MKMPLSGENRSFGRLPFLPTWPTPTDHCLLYIEGKAFEQDAEILNRVANEATDVTALIESNGSRVPRATGIVLAVRNQVGAKNR